MASFNLMLRISFLCILVTVLFVFLCISFVFLYHFILYVLLDSRSSKVKSKPQVAYFLRHYKFARIRVFTVAEKLDVPTSPNRVWVNPNSRYEQSYDSYQQDRYHYDQSRGYGNSRGYHDYNNHHSSRNQSHRHQEENSATSRSHASTFSFTKALEAAKSSTSVNESSSLQQRVKPTTTSPAGSFSFLKALNESTRSQSTPQADNEVYSVTDNLSEEQKAQFANKTFTWGKIPLLPPCAEYC